MIVVPGSSNRLFAYRLSRAIGADYVETEISKFPDGETHIKIPQIEEEAVVVQSLCYHPDQYLMEFLIICDALWGKGCKQITGAIPYLAYARQDSEFTPGEAISLLGVARVIEKFCDRVITVDMHLHRYKSIGEVFKRGVNASAAGLVGEYIKGSRLKDPMVIGPDEESEQWARQISSKIGCDWDIFIKERISPEKIKLMPKEADVKDVKGRDVVIFDDIISTGGTMAEAVKAVREMGAKRVVAACTHAILAGTAQTKIFNAGAEAIVATDTVPSPFSFVSAVPAMKELLQSKI
jgi:ribose-phosphate pyrophosphokinase